MKEPLIKEFQLGDKTYYSCYEKKIGKSNYKKSSYSLECDICTHSIDTKGRFIYTYESNEYIPRNIFCEYEVCPYLKDFEERIANRKIDFEKMMKEMLKGE